MRQSPILVLLTVVTISCTNLTPEMDDSIDLIFDPCAPLELRPAAGTTEPELQAIDSALQLWSAVADLNVSRTTQQEAQQVVAIHFEEASLVFRGLYQDETGDIFVNRLLESPEMLALTVAHELGHALGLPHIDDRESVMNSGNADVAPLLEDTQALSEIWGPCVIKHSGPLSTELRHSAELKTPSQP